MIQEAKVHKNMSLCNDMPGWFAAAKLLHVGLQVCWAPLSACCAHNITTFKLQQLERWCS